MYKTLLLTLSALLALAACKGEGAPTSEGAEEGAAETAALDRSAWPAKGEAPRVKLVERGAEPHHRWALKVEVGAAQQARVRVAHGVAPKRDGYARRPAQLPREVGLLLTVSNVADEGITLVAAVEDTEIIAPEGASGKLLSASLGPQLRTLKGYRGSVVVDPLGRVLETRFNIEQLKQPQVRQFADSIAEALGVIIVPMPDEPVGQGARWEVFSRRATLMGPEIYVHDRFELVQATDDQRVVKVARTISADPQPMPMPGMPAEAGLQLEKLQLEASGELTIPGSSLVATSGKLEGQGEQRLVATMGENTQTQEMTLALSVAAVKVKTPAEIRARDAALERGDDHDHGHGH